MFKYVLIGLCYAEFETESFFAPATKEQDSDSNTTVLGSGSNSPMLGSDNNRTVLEFGTRCWNSVAKHSSRNQMLGFIVLWCIYYYGIMMHMCDWLACAWSAASLVHFTACSRSCMG